jgi:AcrR family transcriptional regulator
MFRSRAMSTVERETQREDLRGRIVEAARDIVSEQGLDGLSMRALAVRIGHSPGTIYLHFQGKDELLRSVMAEGFRRLGEVMRGEIAKVGEGASYMERYAATGRGYARFAVEHTGYFRAMFKMPRVAQLESCPELPPEVLSEDFEASKDHAVNLLRKASEAGQVRVDDPVRAAVVGWGLVHGLTSLYLSGHLRDRASNNEEFMDLVESAIQALRTGWQPR